MSPRWLPSTRAALLLCATFLVLVVAVRLSWVERFAVPLPFWDQWDAEGDFLLRPWLAGTLSLEDMWSPRNEHRLLPSRLLTLALFETTGEWNNVHAARVNTVLAALFGTLLLWLLIRARALHGARWLALPVLVAGVVLPFGWENFLVGFQSQFYIMQLLMLGTVALAAWRPDDARAQAGMLALSTVGCLTMASGLLMPVVALVVLFAQPRVDGTRPMRRVLVMVLLAAIALIAYGTTPRVEGHAPLRAQDLRSLADASLHMLGWPVSGYHWAAPLLWAPGAIAVAWLWTRRAHERADLLMGGLLLWSVLQAGATAYSRGEGLIEPASRYLDLLVPGLVAGAWFCARLWEIARARRSPAASAGVAAITLAFLATFVFGHVDRYARDRGALDARLAMGQVQARNVERYLRTGDPSALQQPVLQIPYPDANRLRQLLDERHLRDALPQDLDGPDREAAP